MTNWFCKNCSITGTDCGPWDDHIDCFSNIEQIHKDCPGFQKGEPKLTGKANWGNTEIEKSFTKTFNENIDELFHNLVAYYKGPDKSCLIKDKWKWVNSE